MTSNQHTCPRCNGTGRCPSCKGAGHFDFPGFGRVDAYPGWATRSGWT